MIKTKLHILAMNIDPRTNVPGKDHKQIIAMHKAASFVVDKEVLDLLMREDVSKSVKALVEAKMVRLPYNPMVVEFETTPLHHEFVMLREHNDTIYGIVAILDIKSHTAIVINEELKMEVLDDGFIITNTPVSRDDKIIIDVFAKGVNIALFMLNTKGIEKRVVEVPESMNRKRAAHGKPSIPTHSVVHVGTIYRRDGTAIKNEGGRGGWHMPMHMRCGYTRTQHFGKNREETRIVYIPPCIVNFKPEEPAPAAPKRMVKL
jgi:hypothetical protein